MKAITVEPMQPGSAGYEDVQELDVGEGSFLVEAVDNGSVREIGFEPDARSARVGSFA